MFKARVKQASHSETKFRNRVFIFNPFLMQRCWLQSLRLGVLAQCTW